MCKNININKYIGYEIRRHRISKGLTGSDLAKLINVSQQQVSRYETGITTVTISQLILISNKLNVNIIHFLPRHLFSDDHI